MVNAVSCKNVLETDTFTCSNDQTTYKINYKFDSQPAFTCSKLTIEVLEQGVKYVQS